MCIRDRSNIMNLCEIKPTIVYRWFMEMFVDSSDWVMVPNVYGMGLFSDGGIFATKPYVCGSSYFMKMMDFKKGDWCNTMDGLYWRFINRNRNFFLMIRRPPRSTPKPSSAASDVYKRQSLNKPIPYTFGTITQSEESTNISINHL